MVLKVFEKRAKSVLAKEKVLKLFRSISTLGTRDSHIPSPNSAFSAAPDEADSETAGALQNWYELRKAEALLHWQRSQNRPT